MQNVPMNNLVDASKALVLLRHKAEERLKHSMTGEHILSLEDVNEILLIAGMELIDNKI
jgi:hypothetical protein